MFTQPMRSYLFGPALFCLAILTGCKASPEGHLIGVWSIDRSRSTIPKAPVKRLNEKIETLISNFRVKLLADHTLVVSAGAVSEGTWSYENGKLEWKMNDDLIGGLVQDADVQVTPDRAHIDIVGTTPLGPIKIGLRKTG